MDINGEDSHLYQTGADAACHVVEKESRRTHGKFDCAAEHQQGEHVEKQMHEVAMQEHVCEQLKGLERRGTEVIKSKILVERMVKRRHNAHGKPYEHIEYQQILYYRRNV